MSTDYSLNLERSINQIRRADEKSERPKHVFSWHCSRCNLTRQTKGERQPYCVRCAGNMQVISVRPIAETTDEVPAEA